MKSQTTQTFCHSDTQPLFTTHSGNQQITPWLPMTVMSDRVLSEKDSLWHPSVMDTGNHKVAQWDTVGYRLTSTDTVGHRPPEDNSEQHGLSHRVHVTLGDERHWVAILMGIGYRGWWVSHGACHHGNHLNSTTPVDTHWVMTLTEW